MTDTSTADELPPQSNGIVDNGLLDDEERARMRPADIDADVREMERRKRVELIMNSKLFREELERIIETQLKDGSGTTGLLQQISDMVGVNKQAGNMFKSSSCVIPINDIRGIESMGYGKGEKILRCKLAAVFRLIDLYGWTQSANTLITARLNQENEQFLVNPYGMLFHEMTASSLIKVDMQGSVLEQGTTNFSVNVSAFSLHAAVHAARPDLRCIIHVHTPSVVAVSALKHGFLPLSQESVVVGEVSTHPYLGGLLDADEKDKLARNLGPINKVLLLSNQGALCCGETIEEAFYNARNTVLASESQLKLLPLGVDNLVLLDDEARKKIYDAAHRAPESTPRPDQPSILEGKVERKWRVGGIEFEGLMRMMDNAGFRTGYIYRHPLVKGEPPKPRNDVEVPPAVSSLGYLLEEEELYRQGLWKRLEGGRKGHDRSRWLNSPNVYQKVEILETGTPDPKKITKWVADGSPSHSSTPVRIDAALQFVPQGTNPREFKQKQQEIKDYRRADKISAGPQSHILEGVTWEEARKMQDAAVTQTGDQVVLMGAASKGIIQRGHQHNAMVYKSPYAKNPFDCVTDDELEEYKKVVEKKAKGEYDTDYSESEGLSSAQINKRLDGLHLRSPTSVTSETEEESRDEPQILRIETTTAPKPSQPEVVLSDGSDPLTVTRYRTNSHAGLPRGSYAVPNPLHFHVARITHSVRLMRPLIKSIPPSNLGDFGRRHIVRGDRSVLSLNLREARSVALDISLDTLKDFISPFARALNFVPRLNDQTSQTSYVTTNFEYTPLYVDRYTDTLHADASARSFEQQILNNMKMNLISPFGADSEEMSETLSFNEEDREGLADVLSENRTDSGSTSDKTYDVGDLMNHGATNAPYANGDSCTNGTKHDVAESENCEVSSVLLPGGNSGSESSNDKTYDVRDLEGRGVSSVSLKRLLLPEDGSSSDADNLQKREVPTVSLKQLLVPEDTNDYVSTICKSHHNKSGNHHHELSNTLMHQPFDIPADLDIETSVDDQMAELEENNNIKAYIEETNDNLLIEENESSAENPCQLDAIKETSPEQLQSSEISSSILGNRCGGTYDVISGENFKSIGRNENGDQAQVKLGNGNSPEEQKSSEVSSSIFESSTSNGRTYAFEANQPQHDIKTLPIESDEDELMQQTVFEINVNDNESQGKHFTSFATEENDSLSDSLVVNQSEQPEPNESLSSEFLKFVDDYEAAIDVINEVRHILKYRDRHRGSTSVDEGIEDPSLTINTSTSTNNPLNTNRRSFCNSDPRAMQFAQIITEHLIEQGLEVRELVVFPELVNDPHVVKLTAKLKEVYKSLFPDFLSFDKRDELRLSIANVVMNLLTVDERFADDSGSSDNFMNVSDKMFTISEYVSEVLDAFFGSLDDNEGFSNFSSGLSNESVPKSTPEKRGIDQDVSVTAFKKDSTNSSESLWIAISPAPSKRLPVPRPKYVNVDDIPLRPPPDLARSDSPASLSKGKNSDDAVRTVLSPIKEEPRINLFDSRLSPDHDVSCRDSSGSNEESDTGGASKYVSNDVNIVVCNEINFYRTKSKSSSAYSRASNVVFTTDVLINDPKDKDEENKENFAPAPANDSGDWMGFDEAKF